MMKLHPFGHGGDILTAASAVGVKPADILDFSANINPLGPPPGLLSYLAQHLAMVVAYPDPVCRKLCEAIYPRYQPKHEIVVGNGAGELIFLLMRILPKGSVLMPAPTFTLYAKAASAAGREVVYHYLQHAQQFQLQAENYCRQIRKLRPAIVMLCNPNNPIGDVIKRDEVFIIAEACREIGAYLVVDEAFLEFHPYWSTTSLMTVAPDNVLVLCSMTKVYAIPGLRLGFLAAPSAIVKAIQLLRDPWSVNTLAQLAGVYILQDEEFLRSTVAAVQCLAQDLSSRLHALPAIQVYPTSANYLFIESKNISSLQLQQNCLQHRVLIRDCSNYQGLEPYFIRVAVRLEEENSILLNALEMILMKAKEESI